ncbi:pentatricopeptide repeat-containing protein, putative [Ricinus communis]|uniref:Pentatricopeptide repeat-containing protein, putative n=1 Tax=Ricinus communis TaxID=3988 RepID=B9SAN9_RICCO|nr:pentatricopeptide repeat-containing protein, putative [Ricinus communis]
MATKTLFKWSKKITPSQVEQVIRAEKDIEKAKLVFDSATAEYSHGFKHDNSTFSAIISKLLSANQFTLVEDMLNRMKQEKCNITEDIFLSICRAYGRVHRPLDSIRVFHKMKDFECKATQKSYITVFAILVEENRLKDAMRFYQHMREMGISASVVSLNVLIKALCKNSSTIDAAFRIFNEMPNRGCNPDSYTYGTLINGLCRFGKIWEAKELFIEMETKCCSPSVVTYSCLIHGDLHKAIRLVDEMVLDGCVPDQLTWTVVLCGFLDRRKVWEASELLAIELLSI